MHVSHVLETISAFSAIIKDKKTLEATLPALFRANMWELMGVHLYLFNRTFRSCDKAASAGENYAQDLIEKIVSQGLLLHFNQPTILPLYLTQNIFSHTSSMNIDFRKENQTL